ncbi:MAG: MMPL family transporter [Acidobacteria bacterium]|nr:MMPL family transporter [Acidobacteriota bacterium]
MITQLWTRLLGGLVASALRRPRMWLAGAAALGFVALGLAFARLELKTSNLDLVDHDLPEVARFISFAEHFGSPNMLVVVLRGPDQASLQAAIGRIEPGLAKAPHVRGVFARLPYDRTRLAMLRVDPYFASRDRGLYFVFVQPDDPGSSAATIAPFVSGVRGVLDGARLGELGVSAGLTGLPQYALDDRDIIQRDISRLSTISFVVVLAICLAGFHRPRRPLIVMGVLSYVALLVVGFAAVIPGHLTLLSAFFFSALFGLGSDYGVYVVHEMEERLGHGAEIAPALTEGTRAIAPGLATAALSTAAAFLTLVQSGFRGFVELGLIGAVGIVLSLLAMVTLVPAVLVVTGDRRRRERALEERRPGRVLLALQRPMVALPLGAAAVVAIFAGVPGFDGDYTHLQPANSPAVQLEREMVERSPLAPQFAAFVAPDAAAAQELVARLRQEPVVGAVRSSQDLVLLDRVALPEAAGRERFAQLFVAPGGQQAVYAYPAGNIWDPEFRDQFLARMKAIDPEVTGMPSLGRFMIDLSQRALAVTAAASGVLVLLLVALEFGPSRFTVLAALPTVLGLAATVGAMRLVGMEFNPLNVMALPVVMGTAIDAGVHLTQRFLIERGDLARTVAGAGHTVLISGLTTIVGFGALAFTSHRGLASFAILLTLGSTICLALSLLVLPVLLRFAYPRAGSARSSRSSLRAASTLVLALAFAVGAARAADEAPACGDDAWRARGAGFDANGSVEPGPVARAIGDCEAALAARPADLATRWRLLEALSFEAQYVAGDADVALRDTSRMVELADEGMRLAEGTPAAADAHFWEAVAWGLFGMKHGGAAAVVNGVPGKVRDHAQALRALDERYRDAAGLRLLGRLHTVVPRVPFVTYWADRAAGIEMLRRAVEISRADPRNELFLAEALLTYQPEARDEARGLLRVVACAAPAGDDVVEIADLAREAREKLAVDGAPVDVASCRRACP